MVPLYISVIFDWVHIQRRTPKPWNFLIKNCVFILLCLNFSHLQSTLLLVPYTYWYIFSTALNSLWTHWFWCLLVLLPFLFDLFYISKMFPFEGFFFSSRETKKIHLGWDWVNRKGGAWGSCYFLSQTAEHSAWYGQVLLEITHHKMGKCLCGESSKKINWSQMLPLTTMPFGILIQMGS